MLSTPLEKNRYSKAHVNAAPKQNGEAKKENDRRNDWFAMIDKIMYMWDRMDGQTLRGHVNVDRYFELQDAVKKFGGAIMDKKDDKISGKTWVKIREPKELQKNGDDMQQILSFLKSELSSPKYWSKPKGDSAEADWESYGKQVILDSMPEIKMGKTPVSEVTSAVKDLYFKMWKSKK